MSEKIHNMLSKIITCSAHIARAAAPKACVFSLVLTFAFLCFGGMTSAPVNMETEMVNAETEDSLDTDIPVKLLPAPGAEAMETSRPEEKTPAKETTEAETQQADIPLPAGKTDTASPKAAADSMREQERIANQSEAEYEAEQAMLQKQKTKSGKDNEKIKEVDFKNEGLAVENVSVQTEVHAGATGWIQPENASIASKPGKFVYSDKIPLSPDLQEYTYNLCVKRGLEYELVLAIMWRESRFELNATHLNTNGTRDNGVMQINDVNRSWLREQYGIVNLMDPYQNINAGTAMLGSFTQKYGSHYALMAYQYGEGGMKSRIRRGQTTSELIELAYRQRDYYRQIV